MLVHIKHRAAVMDMQSCFPDLHFEVCLVGECINFHL